MSLQSERTPLLTSTRRRTALSSVLRNIEESGEITEEEVYGNPSLENGPKRSLKVDHLGLVNAKYESLDYDQCENELYQKEESSKSSQQIRLQQLARWVVMFFIGVCTGLIAASIDITVHLFANVKYSLIKSLFDRCTNGNCFIIPLMFWIIWNVLCIATSALLVAYIAPVAAGSGIPQIKCFLNGVKIPEVVRIKTLFCKAVGLCFAVAGSLAVGKEGPMVHSGAVVAAGISQGRSTTFRIDFKIFEYFRSDQEKRDFVSGGAAAGVSAAFGAPVGGVLFSLEEGASFWNQGLTWRIFFASMVSTFTLNLILSIYHGVPWQLAYSGLVNFGKFDDISYDGSEIPIFIVMGVFGGLLGAVFNKLNYMLTVYRMQYIRQRWKKVTEAILVAVITTVVAFLLLMCVNDCQSTTKRTSENPLQVYCNDGEYNSMATMWFQTYESSVKSLFHDPAGTYSPLTVFLFCFFYFFLACWTYGISIPSGLFIPSLLIGAAWGRLVGIFLRNVMSHPELIDPGKFALIGAAAQLGGILRMTISLTVILVEATGNISFGLPLMIVLMVAKWTGDLFNEGIFDLHIQLQQVPFLVWEPPPMTSTITARRIMSHPVTILHTTEKVERVISILRNETHDGFPVVDEYSELDTQVGNTFGTLRGFISRSQLIVLLKNKAFVNQDGKEVFDQELSLKHFRQGYPRYPKIQDVDLTDEERRFWLNLSPFMNPAPYTVYDNTSLPRIFKLFRGLGLRHLVVIDRRNQVIGVVTRKDLARYRYEKHGGVMCVRELPILMS